jgi:hypothetical protein
VRGEEVSDASNLFLYLLFLGKKDGRSPFSLPHLEAQAFEIATLFW